jgi:hypothetical protein
LPALDLEAIQAALKEQPDGVLDDVARRHGVSLRIVLDLLPGAAARSAPGARFADIWSDLVDWGPVTFIVHTEERPPPHCAMRRDLFCRPAVLRTPVLLAAIYQH